MVDIIYAVPFGWDHAVTPQDENKSMKFNKKNTQKLCGYYQIMMCMIFKVNVFVHKPHCFQEKFFLK